MSFSNKIFLQRNSFNRSEYDNEILLLVPGLTDTRNLTATRFRHTAFIFYAYDAER